MLRVKEPPTSRVGMIGSGNKTVVYIGRHRFPMRDLLTATAHVLTGTDLASIDDRRQFVECVQSMREVEGDDPRNKRLKASLPAVSQL